MLLLLVLGHLPAQPHGVVVPEHLVKSCITVYLVPRNSLLVLKDIFQTAQPGTRSLCPAGAHQGFGENILLVENSEMETIWAFHLGWIPSDSAGLGGSTPDDLSAWEISEI